MGEGFRWGGWGRRSVAAHAAVQRLTERLATSKSEALRRGLRALEREIADPGGHPAIALIGIGESPAPDRRADGSSDPARDHDDLLADTEERSWPGHAGVARGP